MTYAGSKKFPVSIHIYANNRIGLMVDISKIIADMNIDVMSSSTRRGKQGTATLDFTFEVKDVQEMNAVIAKLRQIGSVLGVERAKG